MLRFCFPAGSTLLHVELEALIAKYVGQPAAMVYGMGFATNSTTLPALISEVRPQLYLSCSRIFGYKLWTVEVERKLYDIGV